MDNTLTNVQQSTEYQNAVNTHQKIMANMEVACTAMVELCKNLKLMRDQELYRSLGFESFENYAEQMAGIKQRQAYNYISVYERYGETFLQSNAKLGITKLEILTALPDTKRDDFMSENDVEEMSTRELKETIKQLEEAKEQLSLLTNERDNMKTTLNEVSDEYQEKQDKLTFKIAELEQELKKAQNTPTDVAVADPSDEDMEKIRTEIKKDYDQKVKAEREKTKFAKKQLEDLNKTIDTEKEQAAAEATKKIQENLDQSEQEKAQLLERTKQMEQRLMTAANPDLIKANFYFDELKTVIENIRTTIQTISDSDQETASKLKIAVGKYLEMVQSELKEVK